MPIPNYSVLKGHPVEGRVIAPTNPQDAPHYHIHMQAGGSDFDVAVNVESTDGSEVLFLVQTPFAPAQAEALLALSAGLTPIGGNNATLGLDYVRQSLVQRNQMSLLSIGAGASSPLHDQIDALVQQAIAQPGALLFAFGSAFAGQGANPFFGFRPDAGVHNIHMNQGNPPGNHSGDNGAFQDGALFAWFPGAATWSALYIAFQSQSFAG